MKLITYLSRFTIKDDVKSFATASHLWHLSHIFKTIDFCINGITRNSLKDKGFLRTALNNTGENFFVISICDPNERRLLKHVELIKFIILDRYPNINIEFRMLETIYH